MMVAAPRLSDSLQALVDLRLDTIDRMLLDRVPRQERVGIVGEVEAQIFELLEQSGSDEPTRDEILAVLSRIDPPEAFIPEGTERRIAADSPRVVTSLNSPKCEPGKSSSLGRTGGILGIVSQCGIPLGMVIYLLAMITESETVFFAGMFLTVGLMFLTGILAVIFASIARLKGAWAISGLVTGGFSALSSLLVGVLLLWSFS